MKLKRICIHCDNLKRTPVSFDNINEPVKNRLYCEKCPDVFKQWWKENSDKREDDITGEVSCFAERDNDKHLDRIEDALDRLSAALDK